MSDRLEGEVTGPLSRSERAEAMSKALREAARRSRLSKKNRQHLSTNGYRKTSGNKFRRLERLLFYVVFVLPVALGGIYYAFVASEQYMAEARFTLRGGSPPKLDTLGALTGLPSNLVMQDTQVILNFLLSRPLVERLEKSDGLRAAYNKPTIDWLSRLSANAPIENTLAYWRSMFDFSVGMPSSIIVLKVRAFSREEAVRLLTGTLAACEDLVNDMNQRVMRDTLALSENELKKAAATLADALARLETARNSEGLLSADETEEAVNKLMARSREELTLLQQEYNSQRRYVGEDAPQMRNLNIRIEAVNREITALQAQLTGNPSDAGTPLSKSMKRLDYLNLEKNISEKIYASALLLFEHARLASESKLLYLNVFVTPVLADSADKASHRSSFLLFVLSDFCFWRLSVFFLGAWRKERLFGLSLKRMPA